MNDIQWDTGGRRWASRGYFVALSEQNSIQSITLVNDTKLKDCVYRFEGRQILHLMRNYGGVTKCGRSLHEDVYVYDKVEPDNALMCLVCINQRNY